MSRMKIIPRNIPKTSGVYFFRDRSGGFLYIGKAVDLRARVSSYFNKQPKDPRISKMLESANKVTWQITDTEIEALILESQLIKKYRPSFNVMLRDDKQYFYVGFTKNRFPKIFLTHQIQDTGYKIRDTKFVGPFTDGSALKTTLRLLRRVFPYCTCGQPHNNYCLNYHIGRCPGFCCLKQGGSDFQRLEYLKNIKAIRDILEGKRNNLIIRLKGEMGELGRKIIEESKFSTKDESAFGGEKAIELRDKVEKLEKVFENARILRNANTTSTDSVQAANRKTLTEQLRKLLGLPRTPYRIEGYDISNIQGQFATGSMVVFTLSTYSGQAVCQPDKNQYRKFKIRLGDKPNDIAMLKEMLTRRFNHPEWPYPDLIVIDGGKAQLNATRSVTSNKITNPKAQIPIITLTKNEKHRGSHIYVNNKKTARPLTKLPEQIRNLILQIDAEAHRFAISYYRKLHGRLR